MPLGGYRNELIPQTEIQVQASPEVDVVLDEKAKQALHPGPRRIRSGLDEVRAADVPLHEIPQTEKIKGPRAVEVSAHVVLEPFVLKAEFGGMSAHGIVRLFLELPGVLDVDRD